MTLGEDVIEQVFLQGGLSQIAALIEKNVWLLYTVKSSAKMVTTTSKKLMFVLKHS